jgi:tRNA dimethylallyltransferase
MNYLITIIGPTAIGKTSLSIALAQHFNCDIISCDSRQFYKEMTIGTAVPTDEELNAAKHHFIQNKSIFENYSVGDFENEAIAKLDELFLKNNIQIMVGGSGLFVDAVLKGFDDFPEIKDTVREELNADFELFGIDYLQNKLKELDNDFFQKLYCENPQTLQNPQRMKRFIEVCLGTGKPYSSFLGQKKNERSFTPILIGIEANREVIYERINQRVDNMINQGLVAEAERLYPNRALNTLQTVGYRELFDYFDSNIEDSRLLGNAIEEIKKNTRRFAKRQLTWFKRTENAIWFDYLTDRKKIIKHINQHIKS